MTKVVPSATSNGVETVPKTLDPATVNWSDRPVPAGGGVTRVSVELNVQEFKVDTHNGEFLQATFWVVLEWEDPRLLAAGIDTSDPSAMPKDIWRPAACFPTNFAWADDEPPVTFLSLAPGRLMWWRQTKPTHVDISSAGGGEERFRSFPFDSARVDFLFCMSDEIKLETDVDIELDFDRRNVKSQGGELRQVEWIGQRRQGEFVCTAVTCVEINQCVGCTRQFFTKSFLGDDATALARSSGEEPASPRHRAGVASMAWRTTR